MGETEVPAIILLEMSQENCLLFGLDGFRRHWLAKSINWEGVLAMIARIWRGITPESKADEYSDYLMATGIKDYRETKGNQGVLVLRRVREGHAEFLLLTLWESWDAIHQFAGDDAEKAVYYPKDAEYLLALEPKVEHYEVLLPL